MELFHFYRKCFAESAELFEPLWREVSLAPGKSEWRKRMSSLNERFEIEQMEQRIYFAYGIILNDKFASTDIWDILRQYPRSYRCSVIPVANGILLSSEITDQHLDRSIFGFLNQARGELIDMIDFSVNEEHVEINK
jgi:hypothetical protein